MFTALLLATLAVHGPSGQQTDTTFAVEPGGRLRVDNHQGAVRVRSWDRNAVRVVANHRSGVRIRIRRANGVLRIEGEAFRGPAHGIDYDISVPRSFGVAIDGVNCEALVEGINGDVAVDNVQGDISVRGGTGNVNLESVEGEIIVNGRRGQINTETVNKGIRISDVVGDINAESVNGSIQLTGIDASNVTVESVNGNLQFQGVFKNTGQYRLSSHNGSIRVGVPAGTNANVSVATHSGNVETDFEVQLRDAASRSRLNFVLGRGGARIDLESFSGTIRLVRPASARNR